MRPRPEDPVMRFGMLLALLLALASPLRAQEETPKNELLGFVPVQVFNQHLYTGYFLSPRALAFDPVNQEVWVADTGNSVISIHRPDGIELYSFSGGARLRDVYRIVVGAEGRIYAIEGNRSRIRVLNYRGDYKGDVNLAALPEKVTIGGLAVDADGLLYIGDNQTGQVFVITPEGRLRHQFGSRGEGEGQFQSICEILIGADRSIWVADQQALAIQVFDYQGNFLRGWGRHDMGGENVSLPSGLALDPKGEYVYLSDELRHQVKVYTVAGKYMWGIGENGEEFGQFKYPSDVTVDTDGRMYVSERLNSRVQIFKPVYGDPDEIVRKRRFR